MTKGDRIHLKDGLIGTVIYDGPGDFIGDPKPITVQVLHPDGAVEQRTFMSNEFKLRN